MISQVGEWGEGWVALDSMRNGTCLYLRKKHSDLEYSRETRPEWLALSLSDGVREVMG